MKALFRRIWNPVFAAWMRFAHVMGIINSTILLTLVYGLIILPMKLFFILLRKDPLNFRAFQNRASWRVRDPESPDQQERTHPY